MINVTVLVTTDSMGDNEVRLEASENLADNNPTLLKLLADAMMRTTRVYGLDELAEAIENS